MVRRILTYGDPRLRKISSEIEDDEDVSTLLKDMWDTLLSSPSGVGLAAPQIGVNKRMFVVDDKEGFKQTFINPEILELYGDDVVMDEGCLSIPGFHLNVTRPENVDITFESVERGIEKRKFSGMISRIIQHEYDHLNGILWIDHLKNSC